MTDIVEVRGTTYQRLNDVSHTKKAVQVAKIIEALQESPGVPLEFEQLCKDAGQKYPQDLQAALFALEFTEHVDLYQERHSAGKRGNVYLMWTGPTDPTDASSN